MCGDCPYKESSISFCKGCSNLDEHIEEYFSDSMINREILNNVKDEIGKDTWKRFFMSKKRKERFITVFANTMKWAECCKDNENKIDIPETVDTPDKLLVHLLKTDMIHLPNNPVMNFSLGEDK